MGADTKALRTRIKSVDSTLHLTKAMGLVASSKIRHASEVMNKSRQYSKAVSEIVELLTACNECRKSPYIKGNDSGKMRIIIIAGDRGLAGGYNANVFRLAKETAICPPSIFQWKTVQSFLPNYAEILQTENFQGLA